MYYSLKTLQNYLIILISIFLSACSSPTTKDNTDIQQKVESTAVLTYYFKDNLKVNFPAIYDEPANSYSELCMDQVKAYKDDLGISKERMLELSKMDTALFSQDIIPFAKLIHKDDLPEYTGMKKGQLGALFKNGYYILSKPIFDSTFKFAIVQIGYICGGRCGEVNVHLFKKTDNKWHLDKSFCASVM